MSNYCFKLSLAFRNWFLNLFEKKNKPVAREKTNKKREIVFVFVKQLLLLMVVVVVLVVVVEEHHRKKKKKKKTKNQLFHPNERC